MSYKTKITPHKIRPQSLSMIKPHKNIKHNFSDNINIYDHIFESNINSPISTTSNYKIYLIYNMITAILNHHENNNNKIDTSAIYNVLT